MDVRFDVGRVWGLINYQVGSQYEVPYAALLYSYGRGNNMEGLRCRRISFFSRKRQRPAPHGNFRLRPFAVAPRRIVYRLHHSTNDNLEPTDDKPGLHRLVSALRIYYLQ